MRSALWILAVVCAGCGSEADSDSDSDLGADSESDSVAEETESYIDGRECPPDSVLTYANFGEALMQQHCAGCHGEAVEERYRSGAPLEVNLTSHDQVFEWLDRVYARSADDNTSMPVVDTMSAADRTRLGDWLACGAP